MSSSMRESRFSDVTSRTQEYTSHTDTLSLLSYRVQDELQIINDYIERMITNTTEKKQFTIAQLKEKKNELENIFNQETASLSNVISALEKIDPSAMDMDSSVLEGLKKRKISISKLKQFLASIAKQIEALQEQYTTAIEELEKEQQDIRTTLEIHLEEMKKHPGVSQKLLDSIEKAATPVPKKESEELLTSMFLDTASQPEEYRKVSEPFEVSILEQERKTITELGSEGELKLTEEEIIRKIPSVQKSMDKLQKEVSSSIINVQHSIKGFFETRMEDKLSEYGFTLDKAGNIVTPAGKLTVVEAIQKGMLKGVEVETAQFAFTDYLASNSLHLTPSCNLMTADGKVMTLEAARMAGYLEGLDAEVENIIFPNLLALKQVQMKLKRNKDGGTQINIVHGDTAMTLKEANEAQIFDGLMYDTAHYILSVFLAEKGLRLSSPEQMINLRNGEGANFTIEEAKEYGLLEGLDPEIYQMIFNVLLAQRHIKILQDGTLETEFEDVYTVQEAKMLGLLDGIVLPKEAQDKLNCTLEQYGLRVNERGLLETNVGVVTLKEARLVGILHVINDEIVHRHAEIEVSVKSSTTQSTSSTAISLSSMEGTPNENYLKNTVGVPLVKCLAEVAAKKPIDPIHFIAQWLYNYRIQEENDVTKKQELQDLLEERLRLQHIDTTEEAKKIIMRMIYKAQIDAELARIARMQAETEGEMDQNMLNYKSELINMMIPY